MFHISNFTSNDDIQILSNLGPFTVIEYLRDLSVTPSDAQTAYFCNAMNVRKRQVICDTSKANVTVQAGAMQWMVGNVHATTGVKGVGDFFGKAVRGKVTGESAIKPEYTGDGILVLEPTYKHLLLVDLADWNGSIVLDDGLFLACDSKLKHNSILAVHPDKFSESPEIIPDLSHPNQFRFRLPDKDFDLALVFRTAFAPLHILVSFAVLP